MPHRPECVLLPYEIATEIESMSHEETEPTGYQYADFVDTDTAE